MELITSIYALFRYIIITYEPDSADEFAALDALVGYKG